MGILCRGCAAYGGCKLEKKGTATKCRNHWVHIGTSDFVKPKKQEVRETKLTQLGI